MEQALEIFKNCVKENQFKPFFDKYLNRSFSVLIDFGYHYGHNQRLLVWTSKCGRICKYSSVDNLLTDNTCANYRLTKVTEGRGLNTFRIRDTRNAVIADDNLDISVRIIPTNVVYGVLSKSRLEDCMDSDYFVTDPSDTGLESSLMDQLLVCPTLFTSLNEGNKMTTTTTTTSKIAAIAERSKNAGVNAVQYQAGKAMNIALMTTIKPHLPMMLRGYADHAAAPAIIALGLALASEFLPEGDAKNKVVAGTDLMLNASFMEGADKFLNVEKIIDSVFSKLPPEALAVLEAPAAQ